MHETSYNKMRGFVTTYLSPYKDAELNIADIGAQSVLGHKTYREHFQNPRWRYQGLDIEPGNNVDILVDNPYVWNSLEDACFDVAVSGQALEHIEFPWQTFSEIYRVLKPGGLFCLIVPSSGKEHRFPVDCWRFYPDSMRALARTSGFSAIEIFCDIGFGEWQDTFAVFQKPLIEGDNNSFPSQSSKDVAFTIYFNALKNKPQSPEYYINLAEQLTNRGKEDQLFMVYRLGIERCQNNIGLRQRMVEILSNEEAWLAAAEHTVALLGAGPLAAASVELAGKVFEALPPQHRTVYAQLLPAEVPQLKKIASLAGSQNFPALMLAVLEQLSIKDPKVELHKTNGYLTLWKSGEQAKAEAGFRALLHNKLKTGVIERTTVIQNLIDLKAYKRYLEIGVERGINLFQIDIQDKLAVDPALKTPCGNNNFPGHRFFEITSDDFFRSPPKDVKDGGIDIALIDGLHTYEQALKDVENCLRYLRPNGVIVMHDCLPASEAEAEPSLELARVTPGFTGNWTGDVYKTIIHLRAFRPDLFAAVLDCDHGVGIVYKGTPDSMITIDENAIARLSYTDLRYNLGHWLNIKPAEWFNEWLSGWNG